jgi:ABC-type transport system substrate-binding protein
MKRTKKIIAVFLALTVCIGLLAACGPSDDTGGGSGTGTGGSTGGGGGGGLAPIPAPADVAPEAPPEGANLADHIDIIIDATTITVINPLVPAGGGGPTAWSYYMVHDRLVEKVGPGVYEPGIATSWETDDWKNFTFYLRDNAYFHNGDHFTAEDVVFTVEIAHQNPG